MQSAAALALLLLMHATLYIEGLNSKQLLKKLQDKLMKENYDYMTYEETEEPINLRAKGEVTTERLNKITLFDANTTEIEHTNFYVTQLTSQRNNTKERIDAKVVEKEQTKLNVSNKDLLFYIDDNELTWVTQKEVKSTTANTTYKILKNKNNFRRNMKPQFIQEESANGVVLLKLGKGPFPVIRLPPSRRQYMHDDAEIVSDDDEIPPPAITSSEINGNKNDARKFHK